MKAKRILVIGIVACLVLSLISCTSDSGEGGNKTKNKVITLKWASWQNSEMEKYMLEKFMEVNDNIIVEQVAIAQDSWEQGLYNLASTGDLPDAFTTFDLALATANEWTLDITHYYDEDSYTANITDEMKQAGLFDGVRYGLATWQFPCVMFLNKTLFESMNEPLPKLDWTMDDMVAIARRLSVPKDNIFGVADSMDGLEWIYRMYPVATTENLYEWGFDAKNGTFDLSSWANGYELAQKLIDEKVSAALSAEEREAVYGSATVPYAETGKLAMQADWYWGCHYFLSDVFKTNGTDWLIYPQPSNSGRIQSVVDVGAVASNTLYPKEAYELLKFMTFGADGWQARIDWYQMENEPLAILPIAQDETVWNRVETFFPREDYRALYGTQNKWVPEDRKWMPGYGEFFTWTHEQDFYNQMREGIIKPKDMVSQMNLKFKDLYNNSLKVIKARKQ